MPPLQRDHTDSILLIAADNEHNNTSLHSTIGVNDLDDYDDNGNDPVESGKKQHSDIDTTASTDDSTRSSSSRRSSSISFGTVEIRTFNRELGDHPDCRVGPPLTLSWEYLEHDAVPLDDYEATHKRRANLRLTSITRKNLLRNVFEVPEQDIMMAEKEVQKILKLRQKTKKLSKRSEKREVVVESMRRKLKRMFSSERLLRGVVEQSNSFAFMAR